MKDDLGDRMKNYERSETGRLFMPQIPICARLDGRGFSRFTKGMERPFDAEMTKAMVAATTYLVEKTHARIGYCQSDEISLVWLADTSDSEIFFNGKIQKVVSVLSSMATVAFMTAILASDRLRSYADRMPHFDGRVFQVPNKLEAANAILWRELDATKNAVSMAASAYYSHKALMNMTGPQKQEMLFEKGINFNDYPAAFKRGTFVRRETVERTMTPEELATIPEKHRPAPGMLIKRSKVVEVEMPRFMSVTNRVEVIFDGAKPVIAV